MSKNIKSDSKILKGIKNPTNSKYEIIITTQEFTFFGVKNQPDYAILLSWNMADQIIPKYRSIGYKGKFILPVPELD